VAPPLPDAVMMFNGGTYNIGGTFLARIDGGISGMMTFNAANINADVIKVGVFNDTGVLKIGGGSMNANTLLRLYAPGSNGMIDFVGNVTLSSNSAVIVLAANTIRIEDDITVTLLGSRTTIYANNRQYSGDGGDGTTSGMFSHSGVLENYTLNEAPDFDGLIQHPVRVPEGLRPNSARPIRSRRRILTRLTARRSS